MDSSTDSHSLRQKRKTPHTGRFAFLAVTTGVRAHLFDEFAWSEFGQPKAGPVARSAKG